MQSYSRLLLRDQVAIVITIIMFDTSNLRVSSRRTINNLSKQVNVIVLVMKHSEFIFKVDSEMNRTDILFIPQSSIVIVSQIFCYFTTHKRF